MTTEAIVAQEQQDHVERRREMIEDDPDRELEQDDDELEQTDDDEEQPAATGRALFDAAKYETEGLALPKVDGEGVDKIGAKFTGQVWLDRGNENDVALLKNTKLGQTVTLMVEASVGPPVPGYTTNREGDLDSLALTRKFTITHVYRPTAEEL
jgi:hypothetical protein